MYQHNFDKKENCKRLIDDLSNLEKEQKKAHFFCRIIVKPGDLSQEFIVIDGQQRLTTTLLLLLAMRNWMGDKQCLGERINPNNIGWKDLFIPVIKQLAEINLYPMIELSKLDIQNGLEVIFLNELNAVNSEVTEGFYVYTSLSNWQKMNYIKLLLDL